MRVGLSMEPCPASVLEIIAGHLEQAAMLAEDYGMFFIFEQDGKQPDGKPVAGDEKLRSLAERLRDEAER